MKQITFALLLGATLSAQSADTIESHVAAANALNAATPTVLITLCEPAQAARATPARRGGQPPAAGAAAQPARGQQAPPDRSRWAREPMKVFDNLYYVGEREYSSWAITTSAGIIIIDPIYDYSVEEQVVGGLKKLGSIPRKSNTSSSATRIAIMRAARGICRSGSARACCSQRPTGRCSSATRRTGRSRSATWSSPTASSSRSATRR